MRLPLRKGRGVATNDRGMNKTEVAYSLVLEARLQAGEILWYNFEGMKFRLADKTFYTPDFPVMMADGTMEMHEVKGFMYDDAAVKIKVAADIYPFIFRLVRMPRRGHFEITEV
jgi:hypothetical protein